MNHGIWILFCSECEDIIMNCGQSKTLEFDDVIEWLRKQPMTYDQAAELESVAFAKAVMAAIGDDE